VTNIHRLQKQGQEQHAGAGTTSYLFRLRPLASAPACCSCPCFCSLRNRWMHGILSAACRAPPVRGQDRVHLIRFRVTTRFRCEPPFARAADSGHRQKEARLSNRKRHTDHKDQDRSGRSDSTKSNSSADSNQSKSTKDSNLPGRRLPVRPNLDQLKHQAKDLLRDIRRGDPAAIKEFNAFHPRPIPIDEGGRATAQEESRGRIDAGETPAVPVERAEVLGRVTLADAQLAVARSYEASSWPRLIEEHGGKE